MSNPDTASRFDEIYNSINKAVLRFVIAKCGRVADISDILQDTYLELYQLLNKRGVDYVTNEKALVLRIAKQKIAKYYSLTERLKIFVSMTATNDDGEETELSEFEADAFLTEDFVVNQVMFETVRQFIQQKPEVVKKIFYLFYDVGLTIPEIANELSLNESSVKNRLYRTIKEMRNILNKE